MNSKIYHYCNVSEINTIASNLVNEFEKGDWSADLILTNFINLLSSENSILSKSIQSTKRGLHIKQLEILDDVADREFVCFKQFVWANTYLTDQTKADNAKYIWKIIDANNRNMHRLSYERQMALTHSLLKNLERPEVKAKVDSLIGVQKRITALKSSSKNFESLFRSEKEEMATEEDIIAPSTQKRIVRNIINKKLIPYLNNAVSVLPEQYETIAKVVENHIEGLNTKAKSRETRNLSSRSIINVTE